LISLWGDANTPREKTKNGIFGNKEKNASSPLAIGAESHGPDI
jgi:hypothetical protein